MLEAFVFERIFHFREEQSAGWNAHPGLRTTTRLDDFRHGVYGKLVISNIEQCAYNGANHVAKETIGSDRENE
jgi:hypothetical protein